MSLIKNKRQLNQMDGNIIRSVCHGHNDLKVKSRFFSRLCDLTIVIKFTNQINYETTSLSPWSETLVFNLLIVTVN